MPKKIYSFIKGIICIYLYIFLNSHLFNLPTMQKDYHQRLLRRHASRILSPTAIHTKIIGHAGKWLHCHLCFSRHTQQNSLSCLSPSLGCSAPLEHPVSFSWIKLIILVCCTSGNSLSHPSSADSQTTE